MTVGVRQSWIYCVISEFLYPKALQEKLRCNFKTRKNKECEIIEWLIIHFPWRKLC